MRGRLVLPIFPLLTLIAITQASTDTTAVPRLTAGVSVNGRIVFVEPFEVGARYLYEAGVSGPLAVEIDSAEFNTNLIISRVELDARLTFLRESDDDGPGPDSHLSVEVTAGTRYLIEIQSVERPYCGLSFTLTATPGGSAPLLGDPADAEDRRYWTSRVNDTGTGARPECRIRALLGDAALKADLDADESVLARYEAAIDLARSALGEDHPLYATTLHEKGVAVTTFNRWKESRDLLERALSLREKLLGKDHFDTAITLAELAGSRIYLGDYAAGAALDMKAREILRKRLGERHPRYGLSLIWSAFAKNGSAEETRVAGEMYREGYEIYAERFGPDHPQTQWAAYKFGFWQGRAGNFDETIRSRREYAVFQRKVYGADDIRYASALASLAVAVSGVGSRAEALSLAAQAREIAESDVGPHDRRLAFYLGTECMMNILIGFHAETVALVPEWLDLLDKTVGQESHLYGDALGMLAEAKAGMGDLEPALRLYEEDLRLHETHPAEDHWVMPRLFSGLSSVLRRLGRLEEARRALDRGLGWLNEWYASGNMARVPLLQSRAEVEVALGDPVAALESIEEARTLLSESREAGQYRAVPVEGLRARVLQILGRPHEAYTAARSAERAARAQAHSLVGWLDEVSAMNSTRSVTTALDLLLSMTVHAGEFSGIQVNEAWDAVVRDRGLVFEEMVARRTGDVRVEPEAREAWSALAALSRRTANLRVRLAGGSPNAGDAAVLSQAETERQKAERRLAGISVRFRGDQALREIGLKEVLRALPAGSALVAFMEFDPSALKLASDSDGLASEADRSMLAFVVSAGSREPVVVLIGSSSEIKPAVEAWRAQLAGAPIIPGRSAVEAEQEYRRVGESLRQRIWDPVSGYLSGARRVFIVMDGPLLTVNLSALPSKQGWYLVEEEPILHYLQVERDLLMPAAGQTRGSGLLAIGGPDFDAEQSAAQVTAASTSPVHQARGAVAPTRNDCLALRNLRFDPLPASNLELREVANLWKEQAPGGTVVLEGGGATEEAFKRQSSHRRVLHLATHGFSVVGECVSGASSAGTAQSQLTGLAFAGANRRANAPPEGEDGILTAQEVASLDLAGTEWAVLSACETGIGTPVSREGLFGLRRAFAMSGARTVITSLWPVEDEATRVWMHALYEGRLSGHLGTAEAVQQASRRMLQMQRERGGTTHPYYWAGFIAVGDWR